MKFFEKVGAPAETIFGPSPQNPTSRIRDENLEIGSRACFHRLPVQAIVVSSQSPKNEARENTEIYARKEYSAKKQRAMQSSLNTQA